TTAKPGTRAVDMIYRVTATEPERHLAFESEIAGNFRARTEYTIGPFARGSRLTVASEAEPLRWLHKITTELARRSYVDQFETMLRARFLPMLALAGRMAPPLRRPAATSDDR